MKRIFIACFAALVLSGCEVDMFDRQDVGNYKGKNYTLDIRWEFPGAYTQFISIDGELVLTLDAKAFKAAGCNQAIVDNCVFRGEYRGIDIRVVQNKIMGWNANTVNFSFFFNNEHVRTIAVVM